MHRVKDIGVLQTNGHADLLAERGELTETAEIASSLSDISTIMIMANWSPRIVC